MAIPPIIGNSPLMKLFRTDPVKPSGDARKTENTAQDNTQDIVQISEAAQKKLASVGNKPIESRNEAQNVARDTADILRDDDTLTLGRRAE